MTKKRGPEYWHHCHAGRDGECEWEHCIQKRDGEPERTGRHCPLNQHNFLGDYRRERYRHQRVGREAMDTDDTPPPDSEPSSP